LRQKKENPSLSVANTLKNPLKNRFLLPKTHIRKTTYLIIIANIAKPPSSPQAPLLTPLLTPLLRKEGLGVVDNPRRVYLGRFA
jgi:hypothetical protein